MRHIDIDKYASTFTHLILESASSISSYPSFQQLFSDELTKIAEEFLLYYLHVCDRLFFIWFGPETRTALMNEVLIKISAYRNNDTEKPMPYFFERMRMIHDASTPDTILYKYNQKQAEYSRYRFVQESEDKNLSGLLGWEFGKKIASLIEKPNDMILIAEVNIFASSFIDTAVSAKKSLDECINKARIFKEILILVGIVVLLLIIYFLGDYLSNVFGTRLPKNQDDRFDVIELSRPFLVIKNTSKTILLFGLPLYLLIRFVFLKFGSFFGKSKIMRSLPSNGK